MGLLGVSPADVIFESVPPLRLIPDATTYVVKLTRTMVDALWQIITGRRSVKELGGPLKIAQVAGQQATLGWFDVRRASSRCFQLISDSSTSCQSLCWMADILLFYAIEAVRRRPVSARAQEWAFRGGLAFILALLLFTTVNDLGSFGLWERLGRLIG